MGSGHVFLWSWRESNPRPNKEQLCFLHTYSVVGFRAVQGNRHPNRNLISLSFTTLPELPRRYPEIAEHLVAGPESGGSIREMSRPLTL